MPSKRSIVIAACIAAAGLAGAVFGLPAFLTRSNSLGGTCLGLEAGGDRCRFIGAPLVMAGQPVFMEGFNHAFLPTQAEIDFIDAGGVTWTAPPNTLTDGATIPTVFMPLVGDRQRREYLMAAALHDAYCGVGNDALPTWRTRAWEDVHRMFYEALLVNGTPPQKAKIMFAAVYLGGPRWDDPDRDLSAVLPEVLRQEMQWCIDWIMLKDPPIDAILKWMNDREPALKSGDPQRPTVLDPNETGDG